MLFLPPGLRPARAGVIPRRPHAVPSPRPPSRPRGSDSSARWLVGMLYGSVPPARE